MIATTRPRPLSSYCFAALTALLVFGSADAQEREGWQLVWSDEFDKEGLPNSMWWDWEEGYIRNDEAQYYTVQRLENARVEDGLLVIEARRGDLPGHAYTSASLTSRRSASWTYGRIEARARVPAGRGTWPAIWMLGDNISEVGWPDCGEIDIMEFVGFAPDTVHGTIHTAAYNHASGTERGSSLQFDDLEDAFHTYAVEWEPDELRFYVDEQLYFTFENDGAGDDATWPFHRPQHLKLNLAIGGTWGGQQGIDTSIFPAQFLVDYVRVYQRPEEPPYTISLRATGPGAVHLSPQKEAYQPGETITLVADPDVGARLGKWKNVQAPRSLVVTHPVTRSLELAADFFDPASLNRNPEFSDGLAQWYRWTSDSATARFQTEDGAVRLEVQQAGPEAWHVQFGQGGLELQNGTRYQLDFTAWSPTGHSLLAKLNQNAEPFAAFASREIELSPEPQRYTLDYSHSQATYPNARIEFNLSTEVGVVFLDDVTLTAPDVEALTPYEAWKRDHTIRPLHDAEDGDQDGLPTLAEYLFQTDPAVPDPEQALAHFTADASGVSLAPPDFPATAEQLEGISVSTHYSQDLRHWSDSRPDHAPTLFRRLAYQAAPPIE